MHNLLRKASPLLALSLLLPSLVAQITEDAKVVASDGLPGDAFATRGLDISSDWAVVGAISVDVPGESAGSAYVYDPLTGVELLELASNDLGLGDRFGEAVAIEGDLVLIGATGEDSDDLPNTFVPDTGAAYLFDLTTGQQLHKLRAEPVGAAGRLGRSLEIENGLAAIGAPNTFGTEVRNGAVFVFDLGTGQQLHRLFADDTAGDDQLGSSVALSGSKILAAAVFDQDNGFRSGSAYVFDALSGQQLLKIKPDDGEALDSFGAALAMEGGFALVGANGDDDAGVNAGAAYVFDVDTGQQLHKLIPSDAAENDFIGSAVAITGNLAIIGSERDDENGNASGSAYVFDLTTGQQLAKLLPSDGEADEFFGIAMAAGEGQLVVGSFDDENGAASGSAYLFDLSALEGPTSYCEPAGANSVSAQGAMLTSAGGFGTSGALFDLTGVPDQPGLLFSGDLALDQPFGCGRRCVGGNVVRGAIVFPSGNQVSGLAFDMGPAGLTHVQYWYRDPAQASLCGSSFNLSNALMP